MKYVATLPLAAVFAIGLVNGALAAGVVPHKDKVPAAGAYYDFVGDDLATADTKAGPRYDTRNVYYKPAHGPRGQ